MFKIVPRSRARVAPSLCVLGAVASTLLLYGGAMFIVGKVWGEGRFLSEYRPPNDYEAHVEYAMDYAIHSSEKNDVVFLGDSTCLSGVVTRSFENLTGLRAYNLASVGVLGIDGFVEVLRAYLRHHPRPRLVVFSVHPWSLDKPCSALGPSEVRDHFFRVYGPPTNGRGPARDRSVVEYIRRGAWIAYGHATGGIERHLNEPIPRRGGRTYYSLRREVADQRGYWEHPDLREKGSIPPAPPGDPYSVATVSREGVDSLARLTGETGITLIVRFTPVLSGQAPDHSDHLRAWSNELERKFSNVIVSRPEILLFDASHFGERLHCNRRGAEAFTRVVAKEATRARDGVARAGKAGGAMNSTPDYEDLGTGSTTRAAAVPHPDHTGRQALPPTANQ